MAYSWVGRLTDPGVEPSLVKLFMRYVLCFLVSSLLVLPSASSAVLSIGHRGNSLFAPENTVASFTSARGRADLMELDAQVTSDGQLVVMHDATVNRTTDGTGAIATNTLAELKLLDAGSWFAPQFAGERIPTLEEALGAIIPYGTPLIERKAGTAASYVAELQRLGAVTNVILQSFDWTFLTAVHALEPNVRLCTLGSGTLSAATLTNILNTGARALAWEQSAITSNEVALVHGAGLALFVWTVDGPLIQHFIDLGVDGIISNDPGLVWTLQQPNTNTVTSLPNQLVAYWKMDDGLTNSFATTVADSTGTNAATLTRNDGASHWFGGSTAKFGGCLKLEGTSAFVTLPQTESLNINTNAITLSAWLWLPVLPSQLATSYGAIFDSTSDCYVLYLDKGNKELRFKVTDTSAKAARPGIPEAALQINQWLHIAATYSGQVGPVSGQVVIYLNGQAVDAHTGDDGTSPVGLTNNVKTGQAAAMGREGPTGGNYFTGHVDDVAIWRRALAPAEVSQLYQSGQSGQPLADLLRQPTALIQLLSAWNAPAGNQLQVLFRNQGPWQSFRLLAADTLNGPFLAVPGLTPVSLGNGTNRFDYPLSNKVCEYFRVEGQ
jgi:glycerophosphoryl diester phosphodiesterase